MATERNSSQKKSGSSVKFNLYTCTFLQLEDFKIWEDVFEELAYRGAVANARLLTNVYIFESYYSTADMTSLILSLTNDAQSFIISLYDNGRIADPESFLVNISSNYSKSWASKDGIKKRNRHKAKEVRAINEKCKEPEIETDEEKLNRLLEKVHESGVSSLRPSEKKWLDSLR